MEKIKKNSSYQRAALLGFFSLVLSLLYFSPSPAYAVARTWDGGGATNNWSEAANWSGDLVPVSGDALTFDSTSLKDCTIDTTVSVTSITIASTYSGIITQSGTNTVTTSGAFSIAAGTFTGGSGTIDVNGVFTISGGTFTSTSGLLNIAAGWTHTAGGTFNHNNGSVVADGTSGATWNVATTETFYNYTINKANLATVTISTGDTLVATNSLTLTNGENSTGTLELTGATGSIASTWDGGTAGSTVLIDGVGTQTFTINGGALEPANNFKVNNANATVGVAGTGTITFYAFELQAGTVDTSGYAVDIGSTYTQSGGTYTNGSGSKIFTSTYTQSGGTFNGNSATLDLDSSFTLSGGTFNATSGTMTVATGWTHTAGGTFNHNNGSVVADGTSGATWNVATTETFYNYTINKANLVNVTISTGDTLVATNSLTLTNGGNSTGTLELTGATGSVASTWDGGTAGSTVLIDGAGTQTFTLNGGGLEPANNFKVNNANATVGVAGSGTILFYATELQAGTINTSGYTADNANTFTMSGGTYTNGSGSKTFGSTFSLSGGTFNGNSATLDLDSSFTLSGGTFNATSGTMTVATGWTHTAGGTFNHNNGTVTADGASNGTWDVATTETFGNLIINKANNVQVTIAAGDTLIVTGNLTYTEGKTSAGAIQVNGNVSLAAALDATNTGLTFTGSGTQLFDGGGTSTWDGDITMSSSGTVQLSAGFTLNASNEDLKVTSGVLDLAGQSITVNGASGTTIIQTGATLTLQGGETITANVNYPQLDSGSTVVYNGTAGPYTLQNYSYYNLTIAGGSTSRFSLADNESIGNNLTITSGILSQAGFTLGVTGTFSNQGVLRRLQVETFTGTMDVDSGTVEYVGDNDASAETVTITDFGGAGTDYYNLRINDSNSTKDTFVLGSATVLGGGLQVTSGEFQPGANTLTLASITVDGGTLTGGSAAITDSGAVTISAGTFTGTTNTLQVSGGWTHTAGGTWTHNSGSVSFVGNNASIDVTTNENFGTVTLNKTDGQILTIASGDSLIVTSSLTLTNGGADTGTLDAQADVTVASGFDGGTAPLQFSGGSPQAFNLTGATDKFNADISVNKSSQIVTLASALVMDAVGQDLTITLGTFNTSLTNYGLTVAGVVSVNGGALTLNGSSVDLNSDVSVAGGTLTATSGTMTVAGNLSKSSGTFTHNSGTVTLDGTSQQISGAFNFNNLTKTVTSAATLTLPASTTTTVVGILTLQGASGQLLSIRSSVNNTKASLDPQGTRTTTYLDVKDNNNISTPINCRTGCVDSLNNTNWSIGTPSVTVSESGGSTNVTEGSTTDTYTVVLGIQPTANVTITLSPSSQVSLSASSLSFTTSNWNSAQTVTVTAVNDSVVEGSHTGSISHTSSSTDSGYNGISISSVTANITDNDTAGITVSAISGTVAESGSTATFTVVLTSEPTATVSVGLTSDDTTEGTVSPSSVSFTASNWSTSQTVTVTGVDDSLDDGNISFSIVTAAATSSDSNYNGLNPSNVSVTNTDNDTSGFTVSSISGNTSEAGATATFTVVLTAQPTADVSVGISSSDTTEGTVGTSSITFTSSNWNSAQTITVTGVDDTLDDGNVAYSVVLAAATSADSNYNTLNPSDVSVTNTDGDTAGVTVSESNGSTAVAESGTTDTYTLVLTSQPSSSVTLTLSTTSQLSLSTSTLTFTTSNWNTSQTVTVTAVRDSTAEGNHTASITHTSSSSDAGYQGLTISSVTVTITDNTKPVANAGSDVTVSESTSTTKLSGTSSTDGDGDSLTYAWVEVTDSADGCSITSATSSSPSVSVSNKESSYDCVFQLTVNDKYIDSSADSVTVHVTASNDSPAIGDLSSSVSVSEGSNLVIVVAASDVDSPALTLSAQDTQGHFSAKNVVVSSLFTTSGNSGTFSWTPGGELSGEYTIGFQASDGTNAVTETVAISVTDTNQAPVFSDDLPNVSFVAGTTTQVVFNLSEYVSDPDGDTLTYEVSGNKKITADISSGGKVKLSADADFVGAEDMSFIATDPGGLEAESNEIDVTVTAAEAETDVDHVTGEPKGEGTIKIYDKNNNVVAKIEAFPKGGVVPKMAQIKDKTYVFAIKRRAGTTIHVYSSTGELVKKKRLSPHLHFRHLAVGNLNQTKQTEELVVASKRDHKLNFKVFRFNPETLEFTLLQENLIPFFNRSYRVAIEKKNVIVVLNGKGDVIYSWTPFVSVVTP